MFALRPLTFADRLALCAVLVPLIVLAANWSRADELCPNKGAKDDRCVDSGGGPCSGYGMLHCSSNKTRVIYSNYFTCSGANEREGYKCVPQTSGGGVCQRRLL